MSAFGSARGATSGVCSGDTRFCDAFDDGDYKPEWSIYVDEGDFDADVVSDSDAPDGGSVRLQLSETTGGGTNGVIGWSNPQGGWDDAWTLRGVFYTANIGNQSRYTTQRLLLYYDGSGTHSPLEVRLGIVGGDGEEMPFRFQGSGVNESETNSYVPGGDWNQETWYHYEIGHDGEGSVTGCVWEDGASRPSSANIETTLNTQLSESRRAALRINGPSSYRLDGDFTIEHGYMRWTDGAPDEGDGGGSDPIEEPDELPPGVRDLMKTKRDRIESVRIQAGFLSELYDAGIDPETLDTVAEGFIDGIDPAEVREDPEQYEQALDQLVSAEDLTQETLDAFATSIGAFDKTLLRQYSDSYGKAAVSVALAGLLSKIANGGRFLGNTRRFQNLADDITAGFSQLLDEFVPANRTLDDLAATYDDFARDKVRYDDLYLDRVEELNSAYAAVATEGIKNEPFDIPLLDAFEEAEDEVSNFIGSTTTEQLLTEPAIGPSTIPLSVGPLHRTIPDLPDSISVPFSTEAEAAGDFVGGLIENTADQAGGLSDQIKELESYRIQELEDVDVDIPDEIELPDWFELPDTVEIPQLRFDFAEPLGDFSDVFDVTTQGIDTELQADVAKLVDAVEAGDLEPQDLDLREEFTQMTQEMVRSLRDLADDAWNGLNIIQAGLEVINTGLAGLFLIGIIVALAAVLATNGLSTVLIPILATLLEIIGIIIGIIQAAAVLIGYGFLNLMTRVHTLGVNGLLTDDLEGVPL